MKKFPVISANDIALITELKTDDMLELFKV